MRLPDEGTGQDGHSMPMEGLHDVMGLVGTWHFRQHSADGVRVFLGGVSTDKWRRQQVVPKSKMLPVSKAAGLGTEEATG